MEVQSNLLILVEPFISIYVSWECIFSSELEVQSVGKFLHSKELLHHLQFWWFFARPEIQDNDWTASMGCSYIKDLLPQTSGTCGTEDWYTGLRPRIRSLLLTTPSIRTNCVSALVKLQYLVRFRLLMVSLAPREPLNCSTVMCGTLFLSISVRSSIFL